MKIGILEPEYFLESNIKCIEEKIGKVFLYDDLTNLNDFIKDKDVIFIRLKYNINKNAVLVTATMCWRMR